MVEENAIPISRFKPARLEDHPPGALLVLPAWNKEPAELCLAIKISGQSAGTEFEAVMIL